MPVDQQGIRREESILIVEDNAADAETQRRYLINQGWQPEACSIVETADEAVRFFEDSPPHCVIVDYLLADSDGLALLRRLSDSLDYSPVAVVIATGQGSERVAVQAMKVGAHDYIVKDGLTAEKLRDAVIEALRRNALQLEARRRLDSLTTFVNAVSHDLRRPLTSLGLNLDLHAESLESGAIDDLALTLSGAQQSYVQLKDMLESLHRLVSSQGFDSTVLNLAEVVDESLNTMKSQLETRNLKVIGDDLPTVVANKSIVIEVIQNLIDNALKHSGAETLSVTIKPALDKPFGQHTMAGLAVIDNGQGLNDKVRERILEPGWQSFAIDAPVVRQDPQHAGLGLPICARLMNRLEGKLMADNDPAGGARFFVLFSGIVSGTLEPGVESAHFCFPNKTDRTMNQ